MPDYQKRYEYLQEVISQALEMIHELEVREAVELLAEAQERVRFEVFDDEC